MSFYLNRVHCFHKALHSSLNSGPQSIIRTAHFACLVVYDDMLLINLQTQA